MHSKDRFSEEGLFRSRFSKSSFKFKRKWKVRVPSHASMSKTYANLWFILLQVTKGFRFQKNKNVRFISDNFSSDRFSWKVKTIRYGLHILINKHLQYRCLEFTILKRTSRIFAKTIINFSLWVYKDQNLLFTFLANDYEAKFRQKAFSESVRISHGQHLPPKFFFKYLLLLYAPRLTCNAIPCPVYADFTSSERLSVRRNLLGIYNICLTVLL